MGTNVMNSGSVNHQYNGDVGSVTITEAGTGPKTASITAKFTQAREEQLRELADNLGVSASRLLRDAVDLYVDSLLPAAEKMGMSPAEFFSKSKACYLIYRSKRAEIERKAFEEMARTV